MSAARDGSRSGLGRAATAYAVLGAVLAAGLLVDPAPAQSVPLLAIGGQILSPGIAVARGQGSELPYIARFDFVFQDLSASQAVPAPPVTYLADTHAVSASLHWKDGDAPRGWSFGGLVYGPGITGSGDRGSGVFIVAHDEGTPVVLVEGILTLQLSSSKTQEPAVVELPWNVRIVPTPFGDLELERGPAKAGPHERVRFGILLTNRDAYGAKFALKYTVLPADGIDPKILPVLGPSQVYLEPGETRKYAVEILTPREKVWYRGSQLILIVDAVPVDGGSQLTEVYIVEIAGFYFPEGLLWMALGLLAQLALVIAFIVFARRQYEKRFLGRPIAPWQIPEERAHLERLKAEDPRAYYVTRYFLMEEEYRSALLWFYSYKKISKRQLKAEARAVALRDRAEEASAPSAQRFERASARLQRRYQRRIERRRAWLARRIQRLERKLERNFEKDYEKVHTAWEKRAERVRQKADRPYVKAHKKWERETKKLLARWEKPFRKKKEKYEKKRKAALEKYAKLVKSKDRATWKAWHREHREWEQEAELRGKEGRELPPEPQLLSAVVGPPHLPEPFVEPPKPELPAEPHPSQAVELPPEPAREVPLLAESHYARKGRRLERKAHRKIRGLERELAARLLALDSKQEAAQRTIARKHDRYLKASQAALEPSFVDRVLRRTPQQQERKHRLAYVRGLAREKVKAAAEHARAHLERLRMEALRSEAELEGRIQRERAELRRAAKMGTAEARATETGRVRSLEAELATMRRQNAQRLALERRESEARLEAKRKETAAWEREALAEAERPEPPATPAAAPAPT